MSQNAYEIAALTMRYWFAALMVYIVIRLVQSVWRDYAAQRVQKRKALTGSLGMLEVVEPQTDARGKANKLYGQRFALKRENQLGSSGKCDIRLQGRGVSAVHATIFQKGNRVLLSDYGSRRGTWLNGERIRQEEPLFDGDEIALGEVVLLLHIRGGAGERPRPAPQEAPPDGPGERGPGEYQPDSFYLPDEYEYPAGGRQDSCQEDEYQPGPDGRWLSEYEMDEYGPDEYDFPYGEYEQQDDTGCEEEDSYEYENDEEQEEQEDVETRRTKRGGRFFRRGGGR